MRGWATVLVGLAAVVLLATARSALPRIARGPVAGAAALSAQRPAGPGAVYHLAGMYPNLQRARSGYFLAGTNRYLVPTSPASSDQTDLWFLPSAGGAFKQFATSPYRECHWDLLRWTRGAGGVLVYLATHSGCYSVHSLIAFKPGITYMPRAWTAGGEWLRRGVSATVYSEDGVALCAGTNSWVSRVIGLAALPGGARAVHTQTDESQTLTPIAGAPPSATCPAGVTTSFDWQENFYLGRDVVVLSPAGSALELDGGLLRSTGGNVDATREAGHPQWDSRFTNWEPLPPAQVGRMTAATPGVANASTGNTITFTYVASPGGLVNGVLTIAVPPGWTPPTTADASGCVEATAGAVATSDQTITISGLTLPPNGQAAITYGANSGGACEPGDGATASSTSGAPVWQARLAPKLETVITSLTTSPAIDVYAPDGSGVLTVETPSVRAGSSDATLRFVYAAGEGGLSGGTVTIVVPPGWTSPATSDAPGCTVASAGTVSTSGQTITIAGVDLAADTSDLVTYGATSGGSCAPGDGVTVPDSPDATSFDGSAMSTPAGVLSPLAASPVVTIAGP